MAKFVAQVSPLRAAQAVCLVGIAMAVWMGSAAAAVRQCQQPIASDVVPAPSEMAGKQMALRSWGDKTRARHGEEFSNWRVAVRKVLGCRPAKDGSGPLQCIAFASPCRVEQVPGKVPPKKRPRQGSGTPIET